MRVYEVLKNRGGQDFEVFCVLYSLGGITPSLKTLYFMRVYEVLKKLSVPNFEGVATQENTLFLPPKAFLSYTWLSPPLKTLYLCGFTRFENQTLCKKSGIF